MTGEGDTFRVPRNPRHEYTVVPRGGDLARDLNRFDKVIVVTTEGSDTYSVADVEADMLRLRPRIGERTVRSLVIDANTRWALEEGAQNA